MIYYLISKKHAYTVEKWIEYDPEQLKGRLRILPDSKCRATVREGTFIPSYVEWLSPNRNARGHASRARAWAINEVLPELDMGQESGKVRLRN